ncbi:hypothetical protein [Tuwongella immobilis]|uniref:Uncharacterized protein n=1 Tax=Tuwongella immobilis TaxID=692036 RepID=A0A6C2YSW3_9BACT|nr:hypothetical protein [Tuwongella immobilis]VIP03972.1 unnamed protein product [Tuwongella immobilis]VTS05311.1 unnamed protein product [Tuwongella immobilis]
MAATFLQAVIERLDSVAGLPTVYLTEVPEDSPMVPSAVVIHQGEVPSYQVPCAAPSIVTGKFLLRFFNRSAVDVESLAQRVKRAFLEPLSVGIDANVRCYREQYTVQGVPDRDQEGKRVFMAAMTYSAKFNAEE